MCASQRHKSNRLSQIAYMNDMVFPDENSIALCFTHLYQDLFSSSRPTHIDECLSTLSRKVTAHMNAYLCQMFSATEVKEAVFQMGPYKAPGPDGIGASFFQHHLSVVESDVTTAVLSFLNGSASIAEINSTYLALIPKKRQAFSVNDYMPISLCNVLYKIVAKVLTKVLQA